MAAAESGQIIKVEVAFCFGTIVQLLETVADYCMKVFSLIPVQRRFRRRSPGVPLHGILGLRGNISDPGARSKCARMSSVCGQ
jgi:hypothetical protein